jgi:lysozyme family protein
MVGVTVIESDLSKNPFDISVVKLLEFEGIFSNDKDDKGGETKWGITEAVARENGYQGDMETMPLYEAKKIYKLRYWDYFDLDTIASKSRDHFNLSYEIFESAVNCGTFRVSEWIQRIFQVTSGDIAFPVHLPIIIGCFEKEIKAEKINLLIKLLNVLQGEHYISITLNNPINEKYLKGWMKRVQFY